jgi:ABC-2 type transport system permease protein
MTAIRIAAKATRVGYEDTRAAYTWRTWLFGWVARSTAQVLFFAAMGLLVGSEDFVPYAFIGNVVAATALMGLAVGPDTAVERFTGTLPLLVAAPRSLLPVLAGRSAFHLVQGTVEATVIFSILAPFIGFPEHWWWLPVGLVTVAFGSYGLGLTIAAATINKFRISNLVFNLAVYALITIGGVNIPTESFPRWVGSLADVLPLHHGLLGTRALLADGWSIGAANHLTLELAVGAGWFVAAMIGFRLFSEGGRRDGTFDFAE